MYVRFLSFCTCVPHACMDYLQFPGKKTQTHRFECWVIIILSWGSITLNGCLQNLNISCKIAKNLNFHVPQSRAHSLSLLNSLSGSLFLQYKNVFYLLLSSLFRSSSRLLLSIEKVISSFVFFSMKNNAVHSVKRTAILYVQ